MITAKIDVNDIYKENNVFYKAVAVYEKPKLLLLLKSIDPSFDSQSFSTSFSNIMYQSDQGPLLVMSGCIKNNCRGNISVIVYSDANRKIYLLRERDPQSDVILFGKPGAKIRNLLLYIYSVVKQ